MPTRRLVIRGAIVGTTLFILGGISYIFLISQSQPARTTSALDKALPDKDIVFVIDTQTLGFINSDGSGFDTRKVNLLDWGILESWDSIGSNIEDEFTWGVSGIMLVGRFGVTNRSSGVPFILSSTGQPKGCSRDSLPLYASYRSWSISETEILTVNYSDLTGQYDVVIADLIQCKIVRVLYSTAPDAREGILEANLSSAGMLAISMKDEVRVVDQQAQTLFSIPHARFPAWSPDGQFLVYSISRDGLYLVNANGTERRKLVDSPYPNNMIASWSPDAKWVVYDKSMLVGAGTQRLTAIFKIDVITGQEIELFRGGGVSPNWRWDT